VGADSIPGRVVLDLLEQLMTEPLYDTLRTKEQLGYSVSCGFRQTSGVLGYCVRLQSERFQPAHLQLRVESFLTGFRDHLIAMGDAEFYRNVLALVQNKLRRDSNVHEEAERYWGEISERRYQFDRLRMETAKILTVTKGQVLHLLDAFVAPSAPQAAQLVVHVCAAKTDKPAEAGAGAEPKATSTCPRRMPSAKTRKVMLAKTVGELVAANGQREFFPGMT
jgi:secreted Zn-dependent insulinase-like peptidase